MRYTYSLPLQLSLYLESIMLTALESSSFHSVCLYYLFLQDNIFYQFSLQREFRSSLSCFTHL